MRASWSWGTPVLSYPRFRFALGNFLAWTPCPVAPGPTPHAWGASGSLLGRFFSTPETKMSDDFLHQIITSYLTFCALFLDSLVMILQYFLGIGVSIVFAIHFNNCSCPFGFPSDAISSYQGIKCSPKSANGVSLSLENAENGSYL